MRTFVPTLGALVGLGAAVLLVGGGVALAQETTARSAPAVTTLAAPRAVLEPAVDFLTREPVIDGRLDAELAGLPVRPFAYLYKPNPATPDTAGDYRLAYGAGFLYVFIDVEAEGVVTRDRGYQNGDGFILVLYTPRAGNAKSDEFVQLAYHPTGDPRRPFAQMVWARNEGWPFAPLGDRSAFSVQARDGHVGFEALLRWEDVPPYHPWLSDGIGFNLFFCKAIGDTDVNMLAVKLGPGPDHETSGVYSRLEFSPPVLAEGVQSAVVLERNHGRVGEPLGLKIATVAAAAEREELKVAVQSGEGVAVAGQTVSFDVQPGLSVHEAGIDTGDLATGGYTVRWRSRANTGVGQAGVTLLPPFDAGEVEKALDAAEEHISEGSLETMRFRLEEISRGLAGLKPYDTCPALRATMERLDGQVRAAVAGRDVIAGAKGFVRRAFRSAVDASLQPYTVLVPDTLDPEKTYPALVFLHGSDSDDTSIKDVVRAVPFAFPPDVFVIAPFGRGPSNGYIRDHAQEDIREAVDDALRHYPIDASRLVLEGFSMGGYGVYCTLHEDAGRYVAAAAISGCTELSSEYAPGGSQPDLVSPEFLAPLRGKNIVVLHGGRDRNCPVEQTVDLVAAMKDAGIPVLLLLDEGVGHGFPQDPAIRARYLEWLDAAIAERPQPPPGERP